MSLFLTSYFSCPSIYLSVCLSACLSVDFFLRYQIDTKELDFNIPHIWGYADRISLPSDSFALVSSCQWWWVRTNVHDDFFLISRMLIEINFSLVVSFLSPYIYFFFLSFLPSIIYSFIDSVFCSSTPHLFFFL